MPTKFTPKSKLEYSQSDLNANYIGFCFDAPAMQTTSHEYKLPYDCLIDGACMFSSGIEIGNYLSAQVVDKDNVLGYGTNVVLGQYVTNWYLTPNVLIDVGCEYPAKIFEGLYLKLNYTNVSSVASKVLINYRLHKVMW